MESTTTNFDRRDSVTLKMNAKGEYAYDVKIYYDSLEDDNDSCLGSGTTLAACRNTNHNCMGFEISNEWEQYYTKRCMKNIPLKDVVNRLIDVDTKIHENFID